MTSWLDKARGHQDSKPAPVPFAVECECGLLLSGNRSKRAQRLVCAECGAAQFLLPANQYPETDRMHFPSKAKSAKTVVGSKSTEREKKEDPQPPRGQKSRSGRQRNRDLSAVSSDESAMVDEIENDLHGVSSVVAGVDEDGWQASGRKPISRQADLSDRSGSGVRQKNVQRFLPLLLAFSGLTAGMIYWVTSSRAREQAEVQLKQALEESEQKFFDGQYADAYGLLQTADEAVRVLSVTDERADRVRVMLRQSDALAHLLDASVMEVVQTGVEVIQKSGVAAWDGDFSVNYADRWIVMQIPVPETVQADSKLRYDWMVDDQFILLNGLGTIAAWAREKGQLGEIIFAARLQGCREDSRVDNVWMVEFDPQSAFLWTDESSLIRRNMIPEFDESAKTQMRAILRQQLKIGEAPPPPPEETSPAGREENSDRNRETVDEP